MRRPPVPMRARLDPRPDRGPDQERHGADRDAERVLPHEAGLEPAHLGAGRAEAARDPVDRAVDDLLVEDVGEPLRTTTDGTADGGADRGVVVPGVTEQPAERTEPPVERI